MSAGYTDLLADRSSSDLLWVALHNWTCDRSSGSRQRSASQIRDAVLQKAAIRSMLSQNPHLTARVESVLEEMAHTWSLRSIRFVGFFVTKVLKKICTGVWVENSDRETGVAAAIGRLVRQAPVLYMPSHRSYADFLLLSYVCFSMNLPLPSIAASTDFLSLAQVASLLRSCGAFFIRRSFKDDTVYWETFKAYVEEQIVGCERPLEFFVEGTRSRTGKSLPPKTGLLSIAVSLFLSGAIADLVIIPISISYDRLLEEALYAKEVSPGETGSKPEENTSHMISGVRKILDESYGNVYVRFGQPISVRNESYAFEGKDVRKCCVKEPNLVANFVTGIAQRVVGEQVKNITISPFDLFAFILLGREANCFLLESCPSAELAISFPQIVEQVRELVGLAPGNNLSLSVSESTIEEDLRNSISIHVKKFAKVDGGDDRLVLKWDQVSRNMLRIYANKALQLLIDLCICSHVGSLEDFVRMKNLLANEFSLSASDELASSYAESTKTISATSSGLKSVLSSYAAFYLQSYCKGCLWFRSVSEDKTVTFPLNFKSLTKRGQYELLLTSDVMDSFWLLLKKRDVIQASGINGPSLEEVQREMMQLLFKNNDTPGAGNSAPLQSKL